MRSLRVFFVAFCLLAVFLALYRVKGRSVLLSAEGTNSIRAYEIAKNLEWLNVSRPLGSSDLLGKVVIIDFWTYCCINCMHILPDLKRLEEEFPDDLVVIGAHSAKFQNEKDTDNIREAILRYGIHHPVINDHDFLLWQFFGVQAWPSFVVLDSQGALRVSTSGEGQYSTLRSAVQDLIQEGRKKSSLQSSRKIPIRMETATNSTLLFPGKLRFDSETHRIWISDSNHHRLLRADLSGNADLIVGSGKSGKADGNFGSAEFFQPQGLAVDGDLVYVADTSNHLVRAIDLRKKEVRTIAGTGVQGFVRDPEGRLPLETPLASPWDLAIWTRKSGEKILAIAMAGTHQIWGLDLKKNRLQLLAGTGREDLQDGSAKSASLAQTSGVFLFGERLYFVDSETSSLRYLEDGKVHTLIGEGLFEFGLKDGPSNTARLQHPLGLTVYENKIYIADAYNKAIRIYDLKTNLLSTLISKNLNEPNDVAVIGNGLWIADTNNHSIKKFDFKTKALMNVAIKIPERLLAQAHSESKDQFFKELPFLPNLKILSSQKGGLDPITHAFQARILIELPNGRKINEKAPSEWVLYEKAAKGWKRVGQDNIHQREIEISAANLASAHQLSLDVTIYHCPIKETELSACEITSRRQPIELSSQPLKIKMSFADP